MIKYGEFANNKRTTGAQQEPNKKKKSPTKLKIYLICNILRGF